MLKLNFKKISSALAFILIFFSQLSYAITERIDKQQLLVKQINLIKNREQQALQELKELRNLESPFSDEAILHAKKSLLDKSALDMMVAKSDLEGINIELTDVEQSIAWLTRTVQELENQQNVLTVFNKNFNKKTDVSNQEIVEELNYQKKLLSLEREKAQELHILQKYVSDLLQLRKDHSDQLRNLLQTKRLLNIREHEAKDELHFQEIQNQYLREVKLLYSRLNKLDAYKEKKQYAAIERDIYLANEEASFAYTQSLIARYKDQMEYVRLLLTRNISISLLNEMEGQVHLLSKQINRLDKMIDTRNDVLTKHIKNLSAKKKKDPEFNIYVDKLSKIEAQYKLSKASLSKLNTELLALRKSLERAMQVELSARLGMPKITTKMVIDLGKEILLLPIVTAQVLLGLGSQVLSRLEDSDLFEMAILFSIEGIFLLAFFSLKRFLNRAIFSLNESKLDIKRVSLRWLHHHFYELVITLNYLALMSYWQIPPQNYLFIFYLACVWLVFRGILTFFRLCLIENTYDLSGEDVKWYKRLRIALIIGGIITGFTVFLHQLPLIYELKLLCDRIFLLFLFFLSIILLRSMTFLLELVWQHFNSHHPYLKKISRFLSIFIPVVLLLNAIVGLFGYMNLVFTLSWYEGIFISVLTLYLLLRGLLTNLFEQLSRLVISYLRNGWFWTEAFLKPFHKILRVLLFLATIGSLFLLYGWDRQSPIVEQFNHFLNYELIHILKTTITPFNSIETLIVVAIFYWSAKWSREFVYRMLATKTQDSGIRNSFAILTQYIIILLGLFICLRILGVDLNALAILASMFAFGIGFGLRDLANNFVSGFLILLERPLRVGDIVSINGTEGEVMYIGSRAVTVRTWDHMELVVPNTEIFNKSFVNWTAKDNIVRTVVSIKVSRQDNPHEVRVIIHNVLITHKEILKDPPAEVYLKEISDTVMEFELRYYVNIRQVKSRTNVTSAILMNIWDTFGHHGIKAPYPQHEVFLRNSNP